MELAMDTGRSNALSVLVKRDAAFVLVPHGSRIDDTFRRNPHRTRGIADVRRERAIGIREPVGRVLRMGDAGAHRDECAEEQGVQPYSFVVHAIGSLASIDRIIE
jgi:hypothetical protein